MSERAAASESRLSNEQKGRFEAAQRGSAWGGASLEMNVRSSDRQVTVAMPWLPAPSGPAPVHTLQNRGAVVAPGRDDNVPAVGAAVDVPLPAFAVRREQELRRRFGHRSRTRLIVQAADDPVGPGVLPTLCPLDEMRSPQLLGRGRVREVQLAHHSTPRTDLTPPG